MRFRPSKDIRPERLADMTVIFHRLSGETHILSPETEAIFSAVPPHGAGEQDVLAALSAGFDQVEAEDGAPADIIRARLGELAALGILQRCQ